LELSSLKETTATLFGLGSLRPFNYLQRAWKWHLLTVKITKRGHAVYPEIAKKMHVAGAVKLETAGQQHRKSKVRQRSWWTFRCSQTPRWAGRQDWQYEAAFAGQHRASHCPNFTL